MNQLRGYCSSHIVSLSDIILSIHQRVFFLFWLYLISLEHSFQNWWLITQIFLSYTLSLHSPTESVINCEFQDCLTHVQSYAHCTDAERSFWIFPSTLWARRKGTPKWWCSGVVSSNAQCVIVFPIFQEPLDWGKVDLNALAKCLLSVCHQVEDILKAEPRLLQLSSPTYVLGKKICFFCSL